MDADSFLISKFAKPGKILVPLERLGPLRAFERLCIQVLKMLEDIKSKMERNELLPELKDTPQKANFMSLDGLQLNNRENIREKVMKELEKDIILIKSDLAKRGIKSKIDAPFVAQSLAIEKKESNSRPGSKSIRNLTIFSSDSEQTNPIFKKYPPPGQGKPWAVPFNINKPPFPDLDLQNQQKYKERDPRHQLKYFSIDDSSQQYSQDNTHISSTRLKQAGERALNNQPQMTTSMPRSIANEVRFEMERRIQENMQLKFSSNRPLASRVNYAYKTLLNEE